MGKNIVFKMALVLMLICFCFTISYASDNDIEITTNSNIATSSNIATDSNISVDSSNSNEISISFSDGSSSSDRSSSSGGSYSSDSTSSDDIFNSLLDELKPYIGVEIEASTETSSSGADSLKAEESNKSNIPFVGGFVDDVTSFPLKFWKGLEAFVSKSLKEIFDIAAENSTIVTE